MKNLIEGRKPIFGDPEQIAWLKKQVRLSNALKDRLVEATIEENPLRADLIKDQVVSTRTQLCVPLPSQSFNTEFR